MVHLATCGFLLPAIIQMVSAGSRAGGALALMCLCHALAAPLHTSVLPVSTRTGSFAWESGSWPAKMSSACPCQRHWEALARCQCRGGRRAAAAGG